jgi:hypothetical protein
MSAKLNLHKPALARIEKQDRLTSLNPGGAVDRVAYQQLRRKSSVGARRPQFQPSDAHHGNSGRLSKECLCWRCRGRRTQEEGTSSLFFEIERIYIY